MGAADLVLSPTHFTSPSCYCPRWQDQSAVDSPALHSLAGCPELVDHSTASSTDRCLYRPRDALATFSVPSTTRHMTSPIDCKLSLLSLSPSVLLCLQATVQAVPRTEPRLQ